MDIPKCYKIKSIEIQGKTGGKWCDYFENLFFLILYYTNVCPVKCASKCGGKAKFGSGGITAGVKMAGVKSGMV